ncbi:helix-turn-helix transcriptional regulator [Agrobacterium pusense]|uniref:helix-turn-helix transcriptional regulator n=1 Tax=Agrobacterium pusense TaxID=648995 RepID=UPI00384F14FA
MCDCPLSETELRVVRWLSDGKDCQDIAIILERSKMTVTRHIASSYNKTGTHNMHGLVAFALRKGWLE